MAADLTVTSLREALKAAMEPQPPHAAVRSVTVRAVHLGQAAALLAFIGYQEARLRWELRNRRRFAKLVRVDALLRALDGGLLPILLADPASPRALDLLTRYARHFRASAGAVGGSFANQLNLLADALVEHAKLSRSRIRAKETEALGGRIRRLRSSHVTILDTPDDADDAEPGSPSDDDEAADFDVDATTLRKLLLEVADNPPGRRVKPGDGRRVTVSGVKLKEAAPLRAVLSLQASKCGWAVRGLATLATLASVDGCCQAIKSGFLDVLTDDPTSPVALALLDDFADYVKGKAARVHGTLLHHATRLCDYFIRQTFIGPVNTGYLTAAEMQKRTTRLRRCLGTVRALYISFTDDDDSISDDDDE